MPKVVKLSHAFYDRFGDELVDELVGVLNQVDAASQQSLHDLNEANWTRFADRLDRRTAELRAEIAGVDARITGLEPRFTGLDDKFTAALHAEFARLEARIAGHFVSHMRWMVGMWGAVLLAVMGLWLKR